MKDLTRSEWEHLIREHIIESQNRNTQLILDKMCQQEIDALKAQNVSLQNQLNMANLSASQVAQTSAIEQFILANQPVA